MAECSSSSSPYSNDLSKESGNFCHSFPSLYKGSLILPRPSSSAPSFYSQQQLTCSSSSSTDARATAALRIHSEAEKRRRDRINMHLSTLRRMIPDASKMDKASLLARVVEQVKELKRKAVDIEKGFTIPADTNEVTVECESSYDCSSLSDGNLYIKASVCCEDRPDLFQDLIQAFQDLRLKTIRADLMSIGGRVKNIFLLCQKDDKRVECLSSLEESIKEVLGRIASTDLSSVSSFPSKRRRLLQSHFCNMSF